MKHILLILLLSQLAIAQTNRFKNIGVRDTLKFEDINSGVVGTPTSGFRGFVDDSAGQGFRAYGFKNLDSIANVKVDTIYRNASNDSVIFTIGGRRYAIVDSVVAGGGSAMTNEQILDTISARQLNIIGDTSWERSYTQSVPANINAPPFFYSTLKVSSEDDSGGVPSAILGVKKASSSATGVIGVGYGNYSSGVGAIAYGVNPTAIYGNSFADTSDDQIYISGVYGSANPQGNPASTSNRVFRGIWGEATGVRSDTAIGVYGKGINGGTGNPVLYAGYFVGNVNTTGTTSSSSFIFNLHAIAAGDSVFGNTFIDAADSTMKTWNGTTWITIKDLR